MLFLFTIIIDFVVIKITRISPFQKGFEMGYISLHDTQGRFDIDISCALSFVWFHSGDRRFTVELFMEKSKLAACGLMRFRGAFSKPLRVTSRRISVNPGACRWILMQRLDIDRCRRWRSREIFRWRSPSLQIYYHRPLSIPLPFLIQSTFANFKSTRICPDNRLTVPRFVDTSLIFRDRYCLWISFNASLLSSSFPILYHVESKIQVYFLIYYWWSIDVSWRKKKRR